MITRNHLYCGLLAIGVANGVSGQVADALGREGPFWALFDTFGVSAVVWVAALAAATLLLHAEPKPASKMDGIAAAMASVAFLIPIPQLSWVALTGVALLLIATTPAGPVLRAAVVLGTMTVPMLWARVLFAAVGGPILAIDARLVSWIVGTRSEGNGIPLADGSGMLFLEPACSSLTNLSLVILCGVLIVKVYDQPWSSRNVRAILVASLATVAINVIRMSLIGVFPMYYELIHGPIGAAAAEWTTIIVVLCIYLAGVRYDAPAPA